MSAGGWNLIHTWLTDGILAKNWALIQELLELLLLCPVDIERLKSNNCPKLIKGLSKEGSHQGVRTLASRLVEQWLKIVKGEAAPNSVPAQIMTVSVQSNATPSSAIALSSQQHYSVNAQQIAEATDAATIQVQDLKFSQQCSASAPINQIQQDQERLQLQTVQLQVVGKAQQAQLQQQGVVQQQSKKQSFVVVTSSSQSPIPVYKITIRDGNQVLAKVETDATNINNVLNTSGNVEEVEENFAADGTLCAKQEVKEEAEVEDVGQSDSAISDKDYAIETEQLNKSSEVKRIIVGLKDNQDAEGVKIKDNKDSKDIVTIDSSKSSDKENRDSHKKDEKKLSGSEKKSNSHHHSSSSSSSKSSKHSTSSGTHRSSSNSHKSSSHRSSSSSSSSTKSSSKDKSSKDKHHGTSSSKHNSSRSKSERDKEREKEREKQKKDQAEKDKATLEKVQGQALSSKLGKIPKKRIEDEKSGDASGRKSSTESRDGSGKESKERMDSRKDSVATKIEKKNISISIENRKNSQDSTTRPKTVKTFNSKFRSTGLEEEVKPPPPRSKKPNTVADKKVLPPKLPLKRPSPLRETIPLVEKRAKLSLDSPTTITAMDEKKGGIKLIPPKPKRKCNGILSQIMQKTFFMIRGFYTVIPF